MIILYGLKNCDNCRAATKWLKEKELDFQFIDLKIDPLNKEKLEKWVNTHSLDKVINKKSTTWRQLDGKLKERINSHFQDILLQFPTLIKRPVWEVDSNVINDLEPGFKQNQKDYLEKLKN